MSKFTGGEWEVFGDWGIRAKKSDRQLCENTCHATFEYDRPNTTEGFANAHLIAAAPSMYKEIESDIYELEERLFDVSKVSGDYDYILGRIKHKKSILKLARGDND